MTREQIEQRWEQPQTALACLAWPMPTYPCLPPVLLAYLVTCLGDC